MASFCKTPIFFPITTSDLPIYNYTNSLSFSVGSGGFQGWSIPSVDAGYWQINTCGSWWGIPTCLSTSWVTYQLVPPIPICPTVEVSVDASCTINYSATAVIALIAATQPIVPLIISDLTFTSMIVNLNIAGINIDTSNLEDTNLYVVTVIKVNTPSGVLNEVSVSFPSLTIDIVSSSVTITMSLVFCPEAQIGISFGFNFVINLGFYTINQYFIITIDLDAIE